MNGRERRRLDSWKEIADYLGRNARTVARWERERGLPVHSVPGGRARTVFAFTDELDVWLARGGAREAGEVDDENGDRRADPAETAPTPNIALPNTYIYEAADSPAVQPALSVPRPRRAAMAVVVAATTIALVLTVRWGILSAMPLGIAGVDEVDDGIVARDRDSQELWRFVPGRPITTLTSPQTWYAVADLIPGGGVEVAAAPSGADNDDELLYLLNNRGQAVWERTLEDTVRFGNVGYGPPWRTNAVTAFSVDGQPRIAWTVHHRTWWPSMVQVFDAAGTPLGKFVNFGWISALQPSRDQKYLIAGGLANAYGSLTLAVLDARAPDGTAPLPDDARYVCEGCPKGGPVRLFILPRPDAAEAVVPGSLTPNGEQPQLRVFPDGTVELRTWFGEIGPTRPEVIYEFSADLRFLHARMSDDYWVWHRKIEQQGKLDHPADRCPERAGLRVREWTPESGWRWLGP